MLKFRLSLFLHFLSSNFCPCCDLLRVCLIVLLKVFQFLWDTLSRPFWGFTSVLQLKSFTLSWCKNRQDLWSGQQNVTTQCVPQIVIDILILMIKRLHASDMEQCWWRIFWVAFKGEVSSEMTYILYWPVRISIF